ncbi:MAG: GTP cyclohydrolase I FolE [Lachnospiraceae bacterium]|nr:GTP cyclohydrolase I FolE [Lachnospiraceae bacterium]
MDTKVESRGLDEEKIKKAIQLFLEGIGEDPNREGLIETPDRVARMSRELFSGMGRDGEEHLRKQFSTLNSGLVVEKDIQFYSLCEHHLLPFFGHVHIGYVPDGRVAGLSKLARAVEVYARRLQIQENLTYQIMEAVNRSVKPKGVMVMAEAEHMCMSMRGIKKDSAKTVTIAMCGCFEGDAALQTAFYQAVQK